MLTYGNNAKLYSLECIEHQLREQPAPVTLLDLGCGAAQPFLPLLRKYPRIRYIGVEPLPDAVAQARKNTQGLNVEIRQAFAYDVRVQPAADIVTSFSVLEHVQDRPRYVASIRSNLAPHGRAYINYDAGHFFPAPSRNVRNNLAWVYHEFRRRISNRLRAHQPDRLDYLEFVREDDFRELVRREGLKIIDEKFFNTSMKVIYREVPEAAQDAFMQIWREQERQLNALGLRYRDSMASLFSTRQFIVTHA